jgi:hypothetical protein
MNMQQLRALSASRSFAGRVQQDRLTRRQLLQAAAVTALAAGASLGPSTIAQAAPLAGGAPIAPVPIPGGSPLLGGKFHVFGPGAKDFDPVDAEPSTITDFNGFVGLAYISGMVTRTNTKTGEVRTLPFVDTDMRFMKGLFRGTDGRRHQGSFVFV